MQTGVHNRTCILQIAKENIRIPRSEIWKIITHTDLLANVTKAQGLGSTFAGISIRE
jgi:hypothetical protein